MPSISTLVSDIYALVQKKGEAVFTPEALAHLGSEVSRRIGAQFLDPGRKGKIRLSGLGFSCPRAFWYSIHHPEMAEQLPPWATIKYSYGHILEALVIALAKAAGHEVTGEQDELSVDGVPGHRDCVIDGHVVDVKSASSESFIKFKNRLLEKDDPFGYLYQLDGYLLGSRSDPLVTNKDTGYLLAVDKQLGHMCLYEHRLREDTVRERIAQCRSIISLDSPPDCRCSTIADGKSGNMRLAGTASYNPFKHQCFPNLRTFLYADGRRGRKPVYLTEVVRKPDVPEVDKHGKFVYN